MSKLTEQIEKALNTVGEWIDSEGIIKITRDLDESAGRLDDATGKWIPDYSSSYTFIDILDDKTKGTGKGTVADINKLKKKFNDIRPHLPWGDYGLNADHPTKAKLYQRLFKNDPLVRPSGEMAGAKRVLKTGETVREEFETLLLKSPGKYYSNGGVDDTIVQPAFQKYLGERDRRIRTGAKRASAQFTAPNGMAYYFSANGQGAKSKTNLVAGDGTFFKVVPSIDGSIKEARRRAIKLGQTPKMNPWEWRAMEELYAFAGPRGYHVDHIKPLDKGGAHHWSNLQVLDAQDNLVKGSKEHMEKFFKPKMKGQVTAGPMLEEDYKKYLNIGTKSEEAKEALALNRAVGAQPLRKHVGAAGLGTALAPSSGLGTLQRRLGSVLPFVGAGFDAWDVQQRAKEVQENPDNTLDKLQLGLSTATLGTSFWAEPANFALGMANLGIDAYRTVSEEEKRTEFLNSMRAIGRGGAKVGKQLSNLL